MLQKGCQLCNSRYKLKNRKMLWSVIISSFSTLRPTVGACHFRMIYNEHVPVHIKTFK